MEYDYFLSDLTLRFPMECVVQLSNELQLNKSKINKFDKKINQDKITTTEDALEYLKTYYSKLYNDDNDKLKKIRKYFKYNDGPDDQDLFPNKFEKEYLQVLYNEKELVIMCYKIKWCGPTEKHDYQQYKIMSKYCEPFKLLQGFDDEIIKIYCFRGEMVYVDLNCFDVGALSENEWIYIQQTKNCVQ